MKGNFLKTEEATSPWFNVLRMNHSNESSVANKLRTCNVFVITYYWSEAAEGGHLVTNVILIPTLVLLAVTGFILNSLLIIAYAKNSRLRTLPSMMLIAVACSDFLISTIVDPLYVGRLVMEILGIHKCPLWTTCRLASYFSCGVSLLTITIMTVERFITLAYPYRHHNILTKTRLKVTVIITWCTVFMLIISHLRVVPYSVLLFIGMTLTLLSVVIVIAIWIWIHWLLHKHKNAIKTTQTPSNERRRNTKQVFRNTKTSYIVVASVLICYIPALLVMGYFATSESVSFNMTFIVDPLVEALIFCNAIFNPLLVFYRNKDFRECAREYLPWWELARHDVIRKGCTQDFLRFFL